MKKHLFIILCLLLDSACNSQKNELLQEMEEIKELGNSYPQLALTRLDSLLFNRDDLSTYAQSKYELLKVRLNDKADIMPSSDKMVKELVTYFDAHGTEEERQEAHYYAGSVYRDLQDTPHALEHFLKSMDIAEKSDGRDSLLLRNTYSNLSYLFNSVQDNPNYLQYAKKEYGISIALGLLTNTSIQHLADAYMNVDSIAQALYHLRSLLLRQKTHPERDMLYYLLYSYSYLEDRNKAVESKCMFDSIAGTELSALSPSEIKALGRFYMLSNGLDKAKECYDSILLKDSPLIDQYDAAKYLITICNNRRENDLIGKYAAKLVLLCDTLNLGHNQQMAATVNNLFNYHRDKEEEQRVYEESQRNHSIAIGSIVSIILLSFIGIILFERKKRMYLQRVLSLTGELDATKGEQQRLLVEVDRLKQQNEAYNRLLQFCYLLRMGFSKSQIQNISNLSRVTVWRWEKKYDWVLI